MKKLFAAWMAAVLCLGLAACGGGGESKDGGSGQDFTVDVFIYNFADTYTASVRDHLGSQFDAMGVQATFYDAANNQGTQTNQIETALAKGSDLLIVQIVTTGSDEAAQTIVDMAAEKNTPIVFFNREVSDGTVNRYEKCVFVGTDADEAGYMQGELIADILKDGYEQWDINGDGLISYIMFKGELGNAEAEGRTKYSVEEANRILGEAGFQGLTYYDPNNSDMFQPCNWDSALAQDAMITALGTNPFTGNSPIEMVISNCDDMATGAIEALNEVGYNLGGGQIMIPIFGVDATDVACQAIEDGKMSGTVLQDAAGMAECIAHLTGNIQAGKELMADTDSYIIDEAAAKFRIPYGVYTAG